MKKTFVDEISVIIFSLTLAPVNFEKSKSVLQLSVLEANSYVYLNVTAHRNFVSVFLWVIRTV